MVVVVVVVVVLLKKETTASVRLLPCRCFRSSGRRRSRRRLSYTREIITRQANGLLLHVGLGDNARALAGHVLHEIRLGIARTANDECNEKVVTGKKSPHKHFLQWLPVVSPRHLFGYVRIIGEIGEVSDDKHFC